MPPRNSQSQSLDAIAARREAIRPPVGPSPSDPLNAPFTSRMVNSTDYKAVSEFTLI
jgi:hypothetical protein